MNRTFLKALSLAFGIGAAALSMADGTGWVGACDDPTTTPSNYSQDYGGNGVGTTLFAATIGLGGNVKYETCWPSVFTGDTAGGIDFNIGSTGSVQTNNDEFTELIMGGAFLYGIDQNGLEVYSMAGSRSNFTYMDVLRQDTGKQPHLTKFGKTSGIDTTFDGASDRYVIAESTQDNVRVQLRIDAVGDAARLEWTLTNQGAATNVGMWFGQWVNPIDNFTGNPKGVDFINVPGYKPITTQRRFQRNPNLDPNQDPTEYPMPDYVDFCVSQTRAWEGLRVINSPSSDPSDVLPDQTPVDGFDIGLAGWILGAQPGNTDNFPDTLENDVATSPAYIQKWDPTPMAVSTADISERQRKIVAYYKTTWGNDEMSNPYAVVLDTSKVIGVQDSNPFQFVRSPSTLRVYIDNIRGYTSVDKMIAIENATVTLTLPEGLADANDPTRRVLSKTLSDIEPRRVKFVDFQIQALPTTFGTKQVQIKIEPQPGPTKIVTGEITVASQPYLQITQNANLVGSPWNYGANNWATILGSGPNPLQPDIDYQVFEFNAATQQYTIQTSPKRGIGAFIVSTKNVGFKQLAGSPTTPTDLSTGAPLIDLGSGWNLIANPYNYPIPVGQLVGVPGSDKSASYTYQELVDRNAISGSLAYWDPGTQTYKFIGNSTDMMQPNTGYWINVEDSVGLTLSYPPVFLPFLPAGSGGFSASRVKELPSTAAKVTPLWTSNLVVSNGSATDDVNTFGFAPEGQPARKANISEPPMAPMAKAISAGFKIETSKGPQLLARSIAQEGDLRAFNLDVLSRKSGIVSVKWPEIKNIPSKYDVFLRDQTSGAKINMRTASMYSYEATAQTMREMRIVVETHVDQLLTNIWTRRTGSAHNDPLQIQYMLNLPSKITIKIYNSTNGNLVRTLTDGLSEATGKQQNLWDLLNWKGGRVANGTYRIEITADDGDTTQTKKFTVDIS